MDYFLTKNRLALFVPLCLFGLATLLPALVTDPLHNYKYLVLAFSVISYAGLSLLKGDTLPFKLHRSDLWWLGFIGISFLSSFWAINTGLIWYPAFSWLSLFLWMLVVRSAAMTSSNEQQKDWSFVFLLLLLLGLAQFVFIFFTQNLQQLERWNTYFGLNSNNTAAYLVALLPYLLFFPKNTTSFNLFRLLATTVVIGILWLASAKGVMLAFLFTCLLFVCDKLSNKQVKYLLLGLGALSTLTFIGIIFGGYFEKLLGLGEHNRLYMAQRSIQVFFEKPLTGVGLGNWQTAIYTTDVSQIKGFNHPVIFTRLGNHNLYSQLLAELGLFGFIAFIAAFVTVFVNLWKQKAQLSSLQKASLASLVVYLIGSFFYRDVNVYEMNFSNLQLLAFTALGILTTTFKTTYYSINTIQKILLGALALVCFGWFAFFRSTHNTYFKAFNESVKMTDKHQAYSTYDSFFENRNIYEIHLDYLPLIEQIYHPIFKTTHGYMNNSLGTPKLLALRLAFLYQQQQDFKKADSYFQAALEQAPNNEHVLMAYAKFLLRVEQNVDLAKKHALKVFAKQKNQYDIQLLLAEIAIVEKDFVKAKAYLKSVQASGNGNHGKLARVMLAEIAFQEGQYDQAKILIKPFNRKKNTRLDKLLDDLNQRLKQATQNLVQQKK